MWWSFIVDINSTFTRYIETTIFSLLLQSPLSFGLESTWTTRQLTIWKSFATSNLVEICRKGSLIDCFLFIIFIQFLHLFCINDCSSHLDIEWLDVSNEIMNATGHHHILILHAVHRVGYHWRESKDVWGYVQRLRWLLTRLDETITMFTTIFYLVSLVMLAQTWFSFYMLLSLSSFPFWNFMTPFTLNRLMMWFLNYFLLLLALGFLDITSSFASLTARSFFLLKTCIVSTYFVTLVMIHVI